MDNETLKSLIVQYRDNDKLSFNAIAEKLKNEHGIIRSRQSINGLYSRAKEKEGDDSLEVSILNKTHIVNLFCLGYKMAEIKCILNSETNYIYYQKVLTVVKNEQKYIDSVNESLLEKAIAGIQNRDTLEKIAKNLAYNEFPIKKVRFDEIISTAFTQVLKDKIALSLSQVYQATDDTKLIKTITNKLGVDIKMSDITKYLV